MGAQLQIVLLKSIIYALSLQTVTQHFFEKTAVVWGIGTNMVQMCVSICVHDERPSLLRAVHTWYYVITWPSTCVSPLPFLGLAQNWGFRSILNLTEWYLWRTTFIKHAILSIILEVIDLTLYIMHYIVHMAVCLALNLELLQHNQIIEKKRKLWMLTLHTDPIKYISIMKVCKLLMAIKHFYYISHLGLLIIHFVLPATFTCIIDLLSLYLSMHYFSESICYLIVFHSFL